MAKITLRYRKAEWKNWVYYSCANEAEAERMRGILESQGFIVE
jgi:hypothetical protein